MSVRGVSDVMCGCVRCVCVLMYCGMYCNTNYKITALIILYINVTYILPSY